MNQLPVVDGDAVTPLDGVVLRLVEHQGAQATRRITDNLNEQAWLEDFLEQSKPELPDPRECPQRHRLLLTPFRYHKQHGSRFASRWERGVFYGSRSRFGCLLEGAYYELVFQSGPVQPFPHPAAMRKTLFHVHIATAQGLQLHLQGPDTLQQRLRDPVDQRFCQATGKHMRDAGIQAFEYLSARSRQPVVHVGAISCSVFASTPFDQVDVQTEATVDAVACRCLDDNSVHHFHRQQFEVNGTLPQPAA